MQKPIHRNTKPNTHISKILKTQIGYTYSKLAPGIQIVKCTRESNFEHQNLNLTNFGNMNKTVSSELTKSKMAINFKEINQATSN
jgi:hypothetical protein